MIFLFCSTLFGNLNEIPISDQKDLERFFQILIKRELFGYTLFGKKPQSSACFLKLAVYNNFFVPNVYIIEKGWLAWERNKHLFSDEHFIMTRIDTDKIIQLNIFNINKVVQMIQENRDVFGNDTVENILERVISERADLNQSGHHLRWGLLYGYGKKNAKNFETKAELLKHWCHLLAPPFQCEKVREKLIPEAFSLLRLAATRERLRPPNLKYSHSKIEALNEAIASRKGFDSGDDAPFLQDFSFPSFYFWDENESKILKESFLLTRSKMKEIYKNGSFLEMTFQQWNNPK